MKFSILLIIVLIGISHGMDVNPVKKPVIVGGLNVYTRKFAQLPNEEGRPAQIICIVSFGNNIYVCTATNIYQMNTNGEYKLWFNVRDAVRKAGRDLSLTNRQHGGVRSVAFHPGFFTNGKFYVSFMETRPRDSWKFNYLSDSFKRIPADSVVAEFSMNGKQPNPFSYRQVIRVGMHKYDHPVKQMAFYGDYLYICHGDGSEQHASVGGGQNKDALGKILRINPLQYDGLPYTVPPDNPFIKGNYMLREVWALGFRNPHHLCFGIDGTLYVAESGRANIEEVNIVRKGGNYGWPYREGTFVHKVGDAGGHLYTGVYGLPSNDANNKYQYPAAQVGHVGRYGTSSFLGQAIGGACPVENGSPLSGLYFYFDFPKSGKLYYSTTWELKRARTQGSPWQLTQATTRQAIIYFDYDNNPATKPIRYFGLGDVVRAQSGGYNRGRADIRFGRGPYGELYWSSKSTGAIYLITSSVPGGPGGASK